MSSDLRAMRPITFNEAARLLADGQRPSHSTWWRWGRIGVHGVRLKTMRIGGRRYTTEQFVLDWIAAVTAAANGEPSPARTSKQRQKAIEQAERQLEEDGI